LTKADEGWFEQDSKYGGADKLGHLWSTYVFSDALTGLYKSWGYGSEKANNYAALSACTVQAFMEIGDSTSETQGFSYEDLLMNTMGALTSVLMERYPELDRKIDLRVEYVLNVAVNGIFDDYSNQYYSLVLKLDGFDAIENTFAKYIELSGGYYTRGYEETDEDDTRSLFFGIGFNFSRLLNQNGWKKTGKVLEYLQVPYTVPKASYDLDEPRYVIKKWFIGNTSARSSFAGGKISHRRLLSVILNSIVSLTIHKNELWIINNSRGENYESNNFKRVHG
jgi:hypothetical protein